MVFIWDMSDSNLCQETHYHAFPQSLQKKLYLRLGYSHFFPCESELVIHCLIPKRDEYHILVCCGKVVSVISKICEHHKKIGEAETVLVSGLIFCELPILSLF